MFITPDYAGDKEGSALVAEDSIIIAKTVGNLKCNDEKILEQSRMSRFPEEGDNLLKPNK